MVETIDVRDTSTAPPIDVRDTSTAPPIDVSEPDKKQFKGRGYVGALEAKNLDDELDALYNKLKNSIWEEEYKHLLKKIEAWRKFCDEMLNKGFKDLYKFDALEIFDLFFMYQVNKHRSNIDHKKAIQHQKEASEREESWIKTTEEPKKTAQMVEKGSGGTPSTAEVVHLTALKAVLWQIANGDVNNQFGTLSYDEAHSLSDNYFNELNTPDDPFEAKMQRYIKRRYGVDVKPGDKDWSYYNTLVFATGFSKYYEVNARIVAPDGLIQRFFKKIESDPVMPYWAKYNIDTLGKKKNSSFWKRLKEDAERNFKTRFDEKTDYEGIKQYKIKIGGNFHAKYDPRAATLRNYDRWQEEEIYPERQVARVASSQGRRGRGASPNTAA